MEKKNIEKYDYVYGRNAVFELIEKNLRNINKILISKSALNDSKKLSCKAREELFPLIVANSLSSVAFATVEEIEK